MKKILSHEKMVEQSGGSAAAEGMRRVWSEADCRGETYMSVLSV